MCIRDRGKTTATQTADLHTTAWGKTTATQTPDLHISAWGKTTVSNTDTTLPQCCMRRLRACNTMIIFTTGIALPHCHVGQDHCSTKVTFTGHQTPTVQDRLVCHAKVIFTTQFLTPLSATGLSAKPQSP